MNEKVQKLIADQKKDDTHRIRKQTWSVKTSYTLEKIQEEQSSALVYEEDETTIYNFKKETILKLIKALKIIDQLTPREKTLYLAATVGDLTVRELETVFKKPIKHSRISKILSEIKEDINECPKVDSKKNFSPVNSRRKPRNARAKYF